MQGFAALLFTATTTSTTRTMRAGAFGAICTALIDQMTDAGVLTDEGYIRRRQHHARRGSTTGGAVAGFCVDYVTKPVVVDELIARIGIHIANSKLLQSARDALDSSGRSILAFTRDGNLSWGSQNALETFDMDNVDHAKLGQWLAACARQPLSHLKPLAMNDSEFVYVGLSASRELLVKFSRRRSIVQ